MLSSLRTINDDLTDALALIAEDDHAGALPILARMTSFAPEHEVAHELWVLCHVRTDRMERAIELADECLASELGRASLVIESARDFLRKFEKDAAVLSMLGHAYTNQKAYRRADRAFRDAAQVDPDDIEHHMNVLLLALLTDDAAAFESYLDRLHARDPEMAQAAARHAEPFMARFREE